MLRLPGPRDLAGQEVGWRDQRYSHVERAGRSGRRRRGRGLWSSRGRGRFRRRRRHSRSQSRHLDLSRCCGRRRCRRGGLLGRGRGVWVIPATGDDDHRRKGHKGQNQEFLRNQLGSPPFSMTQPNRPRVLQRRRELQVQSPTPSPYFRPICYTLESRDAYDARRDEVNLRMPPIRRADCRKRPAGLHVPASS